MYLGIAMRYCIALGEEMGKFLYRLINKLSSGKLRVKYTTNPTDANFGGILTCRLVEDINPISNIKLGLKGSIKHHSSSYKV